MLRHGGTAIDAVVAGAFAATVAEPTLASLGGGGFCLVAEPDGEPRIVDFFVNVPGLGGDGRIPHMESLCVTFGDHAVQDFEVGWGSVAVPGALEGLLALASSRSCPSKRLVMNPADRLAILTYLPTRSLLTLAMKSLN